MSSFQDWTKHWDWFLKCVLCHLMMFSDLIKIKSNQTKQKSSIKVMFESSCHSVFPLQNQTLSRHTAHTAFPTFELWIPNRGRTFWSFSLSPWPFHFFVQTPLTKLFSLCSYDIILSVLFLCLHLLSFQGSLILPLL